MKFKNPRPEQLSSDWLVVDDDRPVTQVLLVDGDAVLLGWTLCLAGENGVELPIAENVLQEISDVILAHLATLGFQVEE